VTRASTAVLCHGGLLPAWNVVARAMGNDLSTVRLAAMEVSSKERKEIAI
jgi:hypothetical protein